jgi:hypothetical protein
VLQRHPAAADELVGKLDEAVERAPDRVVDDVGGKAIDPRVVDV